MPASAGCPPADLRPASGVSDRQGGRVGRMWVNPFMAGAAMRATVFGVLLLAAVGVHAAEPRTVPPEVLALIQDDDPYPLPRGLSAEERRHWRLPDALHVPFAPPPGRVRAQAEYEGNSGILVRWGSQNALITQMTVAITTGDPDA